MADNPKALKHIFSEDLLQRMATGLARCEKRFSKKDFLKATSGLCRLEMKQRVTLIATALRELLPPSYERALELLLEVSDLTGANALNGFELWPYSEFIRVYGSQNISNFNNIHKTLYNSLDAMRILTPKFSSEFAIRPYLKQWPTEVYGFLKGCARSSNVHERRWASEGSRPRLPWGEKLHDAVNDPTLGLEIVRLLANDTELYVRKSVANHINDVTKDHPKKALQFLSELKKGTDATRLEWITRHALRTLIKKGNPDALALVGVDTDLNVAVRQFKIKEPTVVIGQSLEMCLELEWQPQLQRRQKPSMQSSSKLSKLSKDVSAIQKIIVDYVVHYNKSNGQTSPKVFKGKVWRATPETQFSMQKKHSFRPVTTRRLYPGKHRIELLVNGKPVAARTFMLLAGPHADINLTR